MIAEASEEWLNALLNPSSLATRYGPGFEEWSRLRGRRSELTLTGLVPGTRYIFVVIAIDEHGAPSSTFSLERNMLFFHVAFEGAQEDAATGRRGGPPSEP